MSVFQPASPSSGILRTIFGKIEPFEKQTYREFPTNPFTYRPEALESIFIMYRITGDKSLQDAAWRMFKNIDKATRTTFGHSSIDDVRDTEPKLSDKMESFWLAETLKYLYLIFSDPSHISLDDYVL